MRQQLPDLSEQPDGRNPVQSGGLYALAQVIQKGASLP